MGYPQTTRFVIDPITYQKVSVHEASRALESRHPVFPQNWTRMRRPQPAERLLDSTSAWLAELQREIRPLLLAQQFPRIANELARLWRIPVQWERYMSELLLVRRGDYIRQGFPPEVARELAALSSYHTALYPAKTAAFEWGKK